MHKNKRLHNRCSTRITIFVEYCPFAPDKMQNNKREFFNYTAGLAAMTKAEAEDFCIADNSSLAKLLDMYDTELFGNGNISPKAL